jgi:hypothetical protein
MTPAPPDEDERVRAWQAGYAAASGQLAEPLADWLRGAIAGARAQGVTEDATPPPALSADEKRHLVDELMFAAQHCENALVHQVSTGAHWTRIDAALRALLAAMGVDEGVTDGK